MISDPRVGTWIPPWNFFQKNFLEEEQGLAKTTSKNSWLFCLIEHINLILLIFSAGRLTRKIDCCVE